jgi:hypothetical protein
MTTLLSLCGVAAAQNALTISAPAFPLTSVGASAQQTVTVAIASGSSVVFQSIAVAPGFSEYAVTSVTGCTVDGMSINTGTCSVQVTFTPKLPGNASAQTPIARSAPLLIVDTENGASTPMTYAVPLTGSATSPLPVVAPGIISDFAGNDQAPTSGFAGDGGPASAAVFNGPTHMAVDSAGNVYISDTGNCVVRRIDKASHQIITVAGIAPSPAPNCGDGSEGVPATQSKLGSNQGIALDAAGNLYIADAANDAVRVVSAATGLITTIAGTLNQAGFSGDGGPANAALLQSPMAVAVDGNGNLYITDSGNYVLREVTAGQISTIAGAGGVAGPPQSITPGSNALAYRFENLTSVAVDSAGNVLLGDITSPGVYRLDAVAHTIAPLANASSIVPASLALDASDTLYLTTYYDCNVYKVPASSAAPVIVAGSGSCVAGGDAGPATSAGLNYPASVVADSSGSFYVLEAEGVRFVDSTGSQPVPLAFGPVPIQNQPTLSAFIFNGDVATAAGNTPVPLPFYFAGGLTSPYTTVSPSAGQDCSQATSSMSLPLNPGAFCALTVQFYPLSVSSFSQQTSFSEQVTSGTATQQVTLSGQGTGTPPTATLTPTSATMSAAIHGGSTSATFTLTNTGSGTSLSVQSISFSPTGPEGFSESDNCSTPVVQAASCTILVTYAPIAAGTFAQSLNVVTNTQAGTQSASITAIGVAPTATLTPSMQSFTAVVAETPDTETFILANTSTVSRMAISSIAIANPGTASDHGRFTQTNTCGTSLAAGAHCTIAVSFAAVSTGSMQTVLTVNDDAGSQGVALSGNATAPIATLSVTSLSFTAVQGSSSSTQTVTVTNTGNAPLTFASGATQLPPFQITGLQENAFSVDASQCPAVLPASPGANTCPVNIRFTPSTGGTAAASLVIADDSGGAPSNQFVQQGVVLSGAAPINRQSSPFTYGNGNFGTLAVGQSMTQTYTLNTSIPRVIQSITLRQDYSDYALGAITGCAVDGVTVNPAGTVCSLQVTFAPTAVGYRRTGTVIVTTIENGQPTLYDYQLVGYSTGTVAAATPGIVTGYLAGTYVAQTAPTNFGQPALFAGIGALGSIALDPGGNLYAADDAFDIVYKVDSSGTFTLFAGTPFVPGGSVLGLAGDGGPAINASFGYIGQIAVSPAGNVFVANSDANGDVDIRRIDAVTTTVTPYVGGTGGGCSAQTDAFGNGCPATLFNFPSFSRVGGIAFDDTANLYFDWTDTNIGSTQPGSTITAGNFGVNRVDYDTGIVTLVAGANGLTEGTGADGGNAVGAAIKPGPLAVDHNGDLLIVDNNQTLRMVTPAGIISTIAGLGTPLSYSANGCAGAGTNGDGGPALNAAFSVIASIAVDAANDIYVVDSGACVVRRIDAGTHIITTVAGPTFCGFGDCGNLGARVGSGHGEATLAGLNRPGTITLDDQANIYIGDANAVRKVDVTRSAMTFTRTPSGFTSIPVSSESGPVTVSVLNAGNTGNIKFQAPFLNGPAYGISTSDFTRDTGVADCVSTAAVLSPGYECAFSIDFTPTQPGSLSATGTINVTALNAIIPVNLYGTASGTSTVTLLPALTTFTSPLTVTSAAQVITLSNSTRSTLPITAIGILGPGQASFAQTNNCGPSLGNGFSCQISVTFTPTAAIQQLAQVSVAYTLTSGGIGYSASSVASLVGNPQGVQTIQLNIAETVTSSDAPVFKPAILLSLHETVTSADAPAIAVDRTPQSITARPPVSPILVDFGSFPISAAASSSLPIVYTLVSGPATLGGANGNVVTPTGTPGNIVVHLDQPGNVNYAPAPEQTLNILVEPIPTVVNIGSGTLPNATVSAPVSVSITIPVGVILNNLAIATYGGSGNDFQIAGGSTCSAGMTGQTCTVMVTVAPSGPGLIAGVVQALDAGGLVIASANVVTVRYR